MMVVSCILTQVVVFGGIEMAAEPIDPVPGPAQERRCLFVAMPGLRRSDVQLGRFGLVIENRRVIAAVKIGVCFHIKMFGRKPAAITQSYCQDVGRLAPVAGPAL